MKLNFAKSIISIGISSLIAYGFYNFHDSEKKLLLGTGSFLFLVITLMLTLAISFDQPRTTKMIRTVSLIFFIEGLISHLIFSLFSFSTPIYIITTGIAFLTYFLISYSIYQAKQ